MKKTKNAYLLVLKRYLTKFHLNSTFSGGGFQSLSFPIVETLMVFAYFGDVPQIVATCASVAISWPIV